MRRFSAPIDASLGSHLGCQDMRASPFTLDGQANVVLKVAPIQETDTMLFRRILMPFDHMMDAAAASEYARQIGFVMNADVFLLHVATDGSARLPV